MLKLHTLIALTAVAGFAAACGGDDEEDMASYYSGSASAALGAAGNEATCATCHAMDDATGFSGSSMKNIAYLTSYKGGDAPTLLDASNACITGWMGGTAVTMDSEAFMMLEAFMQSVSDSAVTTPNTLAPEVLADEAAYEAAYAGGDAAAGEASYGKFCGNCHDVALTVGPGIAPGKAGIASRSIGRIAQKVRTSGPPPSGMNDASDTTPGPMPFFEPDELSAEALKDIIAYVKQ